MILSNEKDTKNIEDVLVGNIMETHYEYQYENPTHQSESGKVKDL